MVTVTVNSYVMEISAKNAKAQTAYNPKAAGKFIMKLYPCIGIFDHQLSNFKSNLIWWRQSKIQNNILTKVCPHFFSKFGVFPH